MFAMTEEADYRKGVRLLGATMGSVERKGRKGHLYSGFLRMFGGP